MATCCASDPMVQSLALPPAFERHAKATSIRGFEVVGVPSLEQRKAPAPGRPEPDVAYAWYLLPDQEPPGTGGAIAPRTELRVGRPVVTVAALTDAEVSAWAVSQYRPSLEDYARAVV